MPPQMPAPQRARSRRLKGSPAARARSRRRPGRRSVFGGVPGPDFRKTLTDAHLDLLETIFVQLADVAGCRSTGSPIRWCCERVDGDIDALITRLAHIRTWTYVAYRCGLARRRAPLAGARARSRMR